MILLGGCLTCEEFVGEVNVIETPKRVLVELEVCNRIDGCRVVKVVCKSCEILIK